MFHDVAADFQELSFVFDWDQRAFHTVVLCQLKWFRQGTHFFDVALDAHVAEDQRCGGDGCMAKRRECCDEKRDANLRLDSVVQQVNGFDVKIGCVDLPAEPEFDLLGL